MGLRRERKLPSSGQRRLNSQSKAQSSITSRDRVVENFLPARPQSPKAHLLDLIGVPELPEAKVGVAASGSSV